MGDGKGPEGPIIAVVAYRGAQARFGFLDDGGVAVEGVGALQPVLVAVAGDDEFLAGIGVFVVEDGILVQAAADFHHDACLGVGHRDGLAVDDAHRGRAPE